VPPARALAREIFAGQRAHDVPLAGIGVLRLVDEDVVGALIELVAHPFAHAGREQQFLRLADQIVEIDQPRRPFCGAVSQRIALPGAKPRGERHQHEGEAADREQPPAAIGEPGGVRLIIGVRLEEAGRRLARIARFGEHERGEIAQ